MFKKSKNKSNNTKSKKKYESLSDLQKETPEQKLSKLETDITTAISNADGIQNSFFYTDESFIIDFDDRQILNYIQIKFPNFGINSNYPIFKQNIFNFLEDDKFVQTVMSRFELNSNELFKFMFRLEPSVFKGIFMKKVKELILNKKYFKNYE